MPADFEPSASLTMLRRRAELLKKIRQFFDSRGFLEVETPVLSHDAVVDRHLDPLSVTLFADARRPALGPKLWLQTSPEFGMKRLLAAVGRGAEVGRGSPDPALTAIYQITRAFRGGEVGPLHNPEFTMVEWYRVDDDYLAGMQLLADFADDVLQLGEAERLTYRDAFVKYAGIDPFDSKPSRAHAFKELPKNADHDMLLDYVLTKQVEPHLGRGRPTILYDYPASQAALARIRPSDPPLAERFELYVHGIELANGYHELLDTETLRQRNKTNNQLRAADGKYTLP
ncbi:MAG: EF-P lysine aminoacylase GenX, partial [Planctomycetia bacterium]|nr:EF-P lysine aminoacylase GenX [Planctomycetia bacterium]